MLKVGLTESGMEVRQETEESRVMLRKRIEKISTGTTVEIEITADNMPEEKMEVVKAQFNQFCKFVKEV